MKTDDILQTAGLIVQEDAERMDFPAPNRLDVYLKRPKDLVPLAAGLRVKRIGYLSAITGIDPGTESQFLEVLYHFCTGEAAVTLRVQVPKAFAEVPSLSEIIPGAEPFERELKEMFGISVLGLRNPAPLYLPEDWHPESYPLRKDFQPEDSIAENSVRGV